MSSGCLQSSCSLLGRSAERTPCFLVNTHMYINKWEASRSYGLGVHLTVDESIVLPSEVHSVLPSNGEFSPPDHHSHSGAIP